MNYLIIEDELNSLEYLEGVLKHLRPTWKRVDWAKNIKEAKELLAQQNYDLIFLDIHLKDGFGIDLLEDNDLKNGKVIITSAYSKYTLDAFKKKVFDYLLKPISVEDLRSTLDYLEEVHQTNNQNNVPEQLIINELSKKSVIPFEDIVYLASDGSYTNVFLKNGSIIKSSRNLSYHVKELNHSFFRCHRSYVINLNHISTVKTIETNYFIDLLGKDIPVSRNKKSDFKKMMG